MSDDANAKPGWSYGAGSRRSLGHHSASQLSIEEREDYTSDNHTAPPLTDDEDHRSLYPSVVSGSATAHTTASNSEVENDEVAGNGRQRHEKDVGDDYYNEEEDDEPRLVVLLGGDEGYKADVEYLGNPPRKKRVTGKKTARPMKPVAQEVRPVAAQLPADLIPRSTSVTAGCALSSHSPLERPRFGGNPQTISSRVKGIIDALRMSLAISLGDI